MNRGERVPHEGRQLAECRRQIGREQRGDRAADKANDQAQGPDGDDKRGDQQQSGQEGVAQGGDAGSRHESPRLTQSR